MEFVDSSLVAVTAVLACLPHELLQALIEGLLQRSAILRTQRDIAEDGRIQMPEVLLQCAIAWVQCVMSTTAALQAQDNAQLVKYLQASEFFQDMERVETLTKMLGARLFQFQVEDNSTLQARVQVLEQLPQDLAVEVVRSAPGSLYSKLQHLPASLRPLAAHAQIPGLAAACSEVCGALSNSAMLPSFDICVSNSLITEAVPHSEPHVELAADPDTVVLVTQSLWLQTEVMFEDEDLQYRRYSVQQRERCATCCMRALSAVIQNVKIALQENDCIVLGRDRSDITLSKATLEGGSVICLGGTCTFDNVFFKQCSLLVLSGAHAVLQEPVFAREGEDISLLVHGAGTHVSISGGSITGGIQGVSVQAGAQLKATGLTVTAVKETGVEVKDEGSSLKLTQCNLHSFCANSEGNLSRGVVVQSHSSATLVGISVTCAEMVCGVDIFTSASASLEDCAVSQSKLQCVRVCEAGTCRLKGCTLSECKWGGESLYVHGTGSNVEAIQCCAMNGGSGMYVTQGGHLSAKSCKSLDNRRSGYVVVREGSFMKLIGCTSSHDGGGCLAEQGASLTARDVTVNDSQHDGFESQSGARMTLSRCSAVKCGVHGLLVQDYGTHVKAEGCSFHENAECGTFACDNSTVVMQGCSSWQNKHSGYFVESQANLRLMTSSSDNDVVSCEVSDGVLTMEELTVDGVCKSGTMT